MFTHRCSVVRQQIIGTLGILQIFGNSIKIALKVPSALISMEEKFLLLIADYIALPVLSSCAENDAEDHDDCLECDVGEARRLPRPVMNFVEGEGR